MQLHLAVTLAIGARLLVLDEPTLGLDILYREQFYQTLLHDFFREDRSILVTTHEVREIEHTLTDVVFIDHGRARLACAMQDIAARYLKVTCGAQQRVPGVPLSQRVTLAGCEYIFADVARDDYADLGELSVPSLAELFVALLGEGPAAVDGGGAA